MDTECPKKIDCSNECEWFKIGGCFQRSELDSCPGCGSNNLEANDCSMDGPYFEIRCPCGWSACSFDNIRGAVETWNTRA
jgi:hypothetical protein